MDWFISIAETTKAQGARQNPEREWPPTPARSELSGCNGLFPETACLIYWWNSRNVTSVCGFDLRDIYSKYLIVLVNPLEGRLLPFPLMFFGKRSGSRCHRAPARCRTGRYWPRSCPPAKTWGLDPFQLTWSLQAISKLRSAVKWGCKICHKMQPAY